MAKMDELITDVRGQTYMVQMSSLGLLFAPCDYQGGYARWLRDDVTLIQLVSVKAADLQPLCEHEAQVRRLIDVHLKVTDAIPVEIKAN